MKKPDGRGRAKKPHLAARNRANATPFWERYTPEPNTGCWLWTGAAWKGYGRVGRGGKMEKAHRLAWELAIGPIPDGLHVLHRCDNPSCINPAHLFLGTNKDNTDDKMRKGRHQNGAGERSGMSKLTEADVRNIRADHRTNVELGRIFGVSDALISMVRRRKIWRHVA